MNERLNLYVDSFINLLTGGSLVQDQSLATTEINVLQDRILTHNKATRVITVTEVPFDYAGNFIEALKEYLGRSVIKSSLAFHIVDQSVDVNPENKVYMNKQQAMGEAYSKYEEAYNSMDKVRKRNGFRFTSGMSTIVFGKNDVIRIHDLWESFNIVEDYITEGRYLRHVQIYIHITCNNNKDLANLLKGVKAVFKKDNSEFTVLRTLVAKYLARTSPASELYPVKEHKKMLVTSDNLSHIIPTKQEGLITSEGFVLAMNKRANTPFFLHPCKTEDAQIFAVVGQPGSGKTFLVRNLVLGTASINMHNLIIDYKGNEHTELAKYANTKIITCDKVSPKILNLFKIEEIPNFSTKQLESYFEDNIDCIVQSILIITSQLNSRHVSELRSVIRKAVQAYYNTMGVISKNPVTYTKTLSMSYTDFLPYLANIIQDRTMPSDLMKEIDLLFYNLSDEVLNNPVLKNMAEYELSFKEILDAPNIIFCLNKTQIDTPSVLENLMIYMIGVTTVRKSAYRKSLGLHTHLVVEEVQLLEKGNGIITLAIQAATAMRANNLMLTIILNSISRLEAEDMRAILSNIKTIIAGKLKNSDIEALVNFCDCESIHDDLQLIKKGEREYEKAFAIQYDTGYQKGNALIKCVLPKSMTKSFSTRTVM